MSASLRAALRLLLLTAVRTGEILRAKWSEFDLEAAIWTVPIEHQKLGRRQRPRARPWRVPLSDQALAQLERLRVLSEGSAFVMASSLAENGVITDKALGHAMRRLFTGKHPLLSFAEPRPTPRDLRRTVRTGLGRLRVPPHIAERCLNHVVGEIESTYDVHDYFDERREALARWGAHVEGLVRGTSNVIPLGASAQP